MSKTKHTPTPYALWPTHWSGGWGENPILPNRPNRIRIHRWSLSKGCHIVAYIEHHGKGKGQNKQPTDEDYANAEFIVRACNVFGLLVETCKVIYKECDGICPPNIGIEIWEQLETALAAAGVKESKHETTNP